MYITGINDVRPPHGVWPGVWSGVWPGAYFEDQGESIPLHQRAVVYYQLLQQEAVSTKTYFFSHFSLFQLLTCNVYSFIKIYCSSWIIRFKSSLSNAANRLTDNQFSPNKPLMYHSMYHTMKCTRPSSHFHNTNKKIWGWRLGGRLLYLPWTYELFFFLEHNVSCLLTSMCPQMKTVFVKTEANFPRNLCTWIQLCGQAWTRKSNTITAATKMQGEV